VFAGEPRSDAAKHAHESPPVMTGVLVVLAFFATIIGFIGVPHLHEPHLPSAMHALSSWLAPSVAPTWHEGTEIVHEGPDSTTIILMVVALGIALVGIAGAWMFYGRGPSPSLKKIVDEGPLAEAYEASKNKLWVDEIYDSIIVKPFRVLARGLFEIVDRFIIDTVVVNGTAFIVGLFGRISRWVQNGQVQRYLAGVIAGAALVFLVTDCHRKPTFTFDDDGTHLTLHAKPGFGLVGKTAKLRWHLHDDRCDDPDAPSQPADPPAMPSGEAGAQVTLCIYDTVSKQTFAITKTVRNEEATP
jgi:hypothetical protein